MATTNLAWKPCYSDAEWQEIIGWLSRYYERLYSNFDELTDVYNQRFNIGKVRADVVPFKPAKARRQVDTATDHLMQLGYNVDMLPWNKQEETKKLCSELIQFGLAFLNWLEREYAFNIRRMCTKNSLNYGMFVLKGPIYVPRLRTEDFDDESWDEMLERTFPFRYSSTHPKNILVDPEEPIKYVIEHYSRTVASVKRDFPFWENKQNLSDTMSVSFTECWTSKSKQFFVNDDPLLTDKYDDAAELWSKQNAMGVLPYEVGYAGFGTDSPDGLPEDKVVGLLSPVLSAITQQARILTAVFHAIRNNMYGTLRFNRQPTKDEVKLPKFAGDYAVIKDTIKFEDMQPQQMSKDLVTLMRWIDDESQIVMANPLMGLPMEGVTSGYQEALRISHTRTKLDASRDSWGYACSRSLDKVLYVIKNLVDEPVGLIAHIPDGGKVVRTIKPSQIHPDYQHFTVTMDMASPEEKDRRINEGLLMLEKEAISRRTIIKEFFGYDPDMQEEQILLERVMRSPEISAILAQAIMAQTGLREHLMSLLSQQNPQQPSQPPQPPQLQGGDSNVGQLSPRTIEDYVRTKARLGGAGNTGEMYSEPEQEGIENLPYTTPAGRTA